ncbi:hypothetical protein ABIE00_004587 [Arthrobacter sp. OAP107]
MASLAAGRDQRDDKGHLDDGHGDGQHQRAEGLADTVRHHFGVMHRRQDGAHQDHRDDGGQHWAGGDSPSHRQHYQADDGNDGGPGRTEPGQHSAILSVLALQS